MANRKLVIGSVVAAVLFLGIAVVAAVLVPNYTAITLALRGGTHLVLKVGDYGDNSRDLTGQTTGVLEARMQQLGIAASVTPRKGAQNEIVVDLPFGADVTVAKLAIRFLGEFEVLELIDGPFSDAGVAMEKLGGRLPQNSKLLPTRRENPGGVYLVSATPILTKQNIKQASASDRSGMWETHISLTADSAERFGEFTEHHINKQVAVVVDNVVFSTPVILARIESPIAVSATNEDEAKAVATVIQFAALPAPLIFLEERVLPARF